jgi:hypothetical protein
MERNSPLDLSPQRADHFPSDCKHALARGPARTVETPKFMFAKIGSRQLTSTCSFNIILSDFSLHCVQIASLVIANTRSLETQVERAQEDSGLAKDTADLAAGKCGALAAELVKLNKQLTAVMQEKQMLMTAIEA